MSAFMSVYSLRNLVKRKICLKNPENSSCIDLILTNIPRSFENSNVVETEFSDFRKLKTTVQKQYFPKLKRKVVNYRDYWKFLNNEFRNKFDNAILKQDIENMESQKIWNTNISLIFP